MSSAFAKLFLGKIRKMVNNGNRHFVQRYDYPDKRNYIQQLASLGLTVDDAWKYILQLDETHYFAGPLADANEKFDSGKNVVWEFKMEIDGKIAYIKLKDEEGGRGCVCLSFHEDHPDWAY